MKKTIALLAFVLLGSTAAQADQAVYDKHCKGCHIAGIAGAPKTGDKAVWAPRIATGIDAMVATVKAGKGAMPPKGTCMSCDDAQLTSAVQIFIDQVK